MENTCSLCRTDNNCQMNNQENDCWCTTLTFPGETLRNIQNGTLPSYCICKSCAIKLGAYKS